MMLLQSRWALALTCFVLLAILPLLASAQALPDIENTEHIEQFDVEIFIVRSGEIEVTETIRYHFGSGERHGLYRDIPKDTVTPLGVRQSLEIDIDTVRDIAGNSVPYDVDHSSGNLRLKIGDPDRLVSGVITYVIRYRVTGALSFFKDFDELYWDAIGTRWTVPIKTASITIRTAEPTVDTRFACYIGQQGSTARCDADMKGPFDTKKGVRVVWDEMLLTGSGITIALGFARGFVIEPSILSRTIRFLVNNPLILSPFIVFVVMFRRWRKDGQDPKGRGTIIPEYDVPENFSPLHMAVLQDGRLSGKEIPAAIIDLAVKGYLVIERVSEKGLFLNSTDYRLQETKKRFVSDSIEKALLDALFVSDVLNAFETEKIRPWLQARWLPKIVQQSIEARLSQSTLTESAPRTVKVSELKNKFYRRIPELEKRAVSDLVSRRFLAKSPQEVWGKYTLWGIGILFVSFFILPMFQLEGVNVMALLLCIPIYIIFAYLMPRVTREGAIAKEHLLGLKEYLQVAEKRRLEFHNAPEKTPALFEKLLPAALLLGVSDIWAKEFADITIAEPEWYRGGNAVSFSAPAFAADLGGFSTAAASSLASAPSGSGSGGGGFAGGGGGGGGGGSW